MLNVEQLTQDLTLVRHYNNQQETERDEIMTVII